MPSMSTSKNNINFFFRFVLLEFLLDNHKGQIVFGCERVPLQQQSVDFMDAFICAQG